MSTVHVPAKVKAEVEAKLRACIAVAEDHFVGQKFAFPTILYTKRGQTAGTATLSEWTVNFNSILLMENLEDFMNRTVPHEMAHLIDFQINPENFQSGGISYDRYGRVRRGKRSVHGPSWKRIMMLFGAPTSAFHSYDTTNSKVKKATRAKFEYVCQTCGTKMHLGAKRHYKMARGMAKYWMRGCGRHAGYQYVGLEGQTAVLPKAASAPAPKPAPKKARAPKAGSKMERALVIYNDLAGKGHGRKMTIQRFMDVLDMSKAGASTYFYNIQKKVG